MLDVGSREINLNLTVDEITFIIAGLRDQAAGCQKRIDRGTDEVQMEQDIQMQNLQLADHLEQTYVSQLGTEPACPDLNEACRGCNDPMCPHCS